MRTNVVLMGGGIDSTALLLYLLKSRRDNCNAMHIDYGQKAIDEELRAVMYFCDKYSVPLKRLRVPIEEIASAGILRNGDEGTNQLEGRNVIFAMLAATYAVTVGADTVSLGFHAAEPGGTAYPDCTADTLEAMQVLLYRAYSTNIRIEAPFIKKSHQAILTLGCTLDVDFLAKTHTCYENVPGGCGTCVHCRQRDVMIHNMMHPASQKPLPENY